MLSWERESRAEDLEDLWSAGDALACLSVRSGFDLWLEALQLPPGSEVLVSAITIRDMVRIIEAHNLVPVPVDLNPEDLSVDIESLQCAITPKTRAILVAHLFGTRQPMKPILDVARKHGLFVAEDCAQAFAGRHFTGDPAADVTMFSFGTIKTATALGGGLLCVRDAAGAGPDRRTAGRYPIQSRSAFAKKIVKHALMKLMSYGPQFGALVLGMRLAGRDPDQFVASSVRGFPGPQLLPLIRRQPVPLSGDPAPADRVFQSWSARLAAPTAANGCFRCSMARCPFPAQKPKSTVFGCFPFCTTSRIN